MLKVVGAGFGRTGTFSLKNALEAIGFGPCYHMAEVFRHPEHNALWDRAADGIFDWEAIFSGYSAAVDWPACAFYGPLAEAYPDAKVVLTVRDPDAWYESARRTIHAGGVEEPPDDQDPGDRMRTRIIWQGTFGGRFDDRAHALEVFHRHIDEVRRRIPAERLLVYDVREGWEPLCRFLAVPTPTAPFPHLNTGEEFRSRHGIRTAE